MSTLQYKCIKMSTLLFMCLKKQEINQNIVPGGECPMLTCTLRHYLYCYTVIQYCITI